MLPKEEFIGADAPIPAPPWATHRTPPRPISLHEATEAARDRAALHARYELLAGVDDDSRNEPPPMLDGDAEEEHYWALVEAYREGTRWGMLIGSITGALVATTIGLCVSAVVPLSRAFGG